MVTVTEMTRGQTLVDFCAEHKLVITNTLFHLHDRHRYTWNSPDGVTRSQIDYIMISKQWKQSVNNARTCLSADCDSDSDHNIVVLTMQLRLKKKRVAKPLLLDLDKLRTDQFKQQYQVEVTNRFAELEAASSESHTPDELWQQLKDVTLNAAKATVQNDGKKTQKFLFSLLIFLPCHLCVCFCGCCTVLRNKVYKSWISSDIFQLTERKRIAKAQTSTEYKRLRSEVQKML